MDIISLHKQGLTISAISRRTGHDRKTIRQRIKNATNPPRVRKSTPKTNRLEPYKAHIKERFLEHQLSAVRLFEEVQAMGYEGSLRSVRRYLTELRAGLKASSKLTVRFETPLGQQAQVDWFEPSMLTWADGSAQKVYGFEIVLGASRLAYCTYTLDTTLPTLIKCLEDAFAFFGGVPHELLFDNMATVRVPTTRKLNPTMLDFAKHHGFIARTHRPYRCRTKGKVERFGGYAQDNFLKGRSFENLDDLNQQNNSWLTKVNQRIHGTTGRKPIDDWRLNEKAHLQPLVSPYTGIPVLRKVNAEAMVHYEGNCYSVPPALCQEEVFVQSDIGTIVIRHQDLIVAKHPEAKGKGKHVTKREHLDERWRLSVPPEILQQYPLPLPDTNVATASLMQYEEAYL